MEEQKKPQGWKDVQLSPELPLNVLVHFLNVLNQRLVAIEDTVTVPYGNRMITLSELYAIQAEEQLKAQAADAAGKQEQPDETKGA